MTLNQTPPLPLILPLPHAVSRLRGARLACSVKPFLARGGAKAERCAGCRLVATHCLCAVRPVVPVRAGVCLIMADIEPLKPSNTGWLVADMVPSTFAFGWARTGADPALLALLLDEQWQPYLVFPAAFVPGGRVVSALQPPDVSEAITASKATTASKADIASATRRPLFVLLDGTWPEARKMFRKSPYLDSLPVLSPQTQQVSGYKLRRSQQGHHLCTSEVVALCLALNDEPLAAQTLAAYLAVFTSHYLLAKQQLPVDWASPEHQRLISLQANKHGREQLLIQE